MPLCPLKPGHILGNSGIVQLWGNVKILLWSSVTAWRLCYQWCITWFSFLSGCCDKILWQKATIERKSRQWESEVAAHMTSTAKSREQWANNVCTLVLSSLSTLLCNPGYSTQRMEPPTVGRFSHWWRLSRPTEFKQSFTETLFPNRLCQFDNENSASNNYSGVCHGVWRLGNAILVVSLLSETQEHVWKCLVSILPKGGDQRLRSSVV